MRRTLSTFTTLFVMILNILNSRASTESFEQMPLIPTDKLLKSESQSIPTQVKSLLIYPTPIAFKYEILPFLSSEHIIKIYDYLKTSYPHLNLSKWLECFNTNMVLDLKESKILYWVSPSKPILYSPENKSAIIAQNFDPNILPEVYCALLPSNKIVPFQPQNLLSFDETFMVAENLDENEFWIMDKYFVIIAYGKVSKTEFRNYKDYIFEAQNLNGSKKCFFKMQYYATIPFVKYLKCISSFLKIMFNFTHKTDMWLLSNWRKFEDYLTENYCQALVCLIGFPVLCLFVVFVLVMYWATYSVTYHTIMFPFHILTLPATTLCLFRLTFVSFCGFPIALFWVYSFLFPNFIDDFLIAFTQVVHTNKVFILPSTSSFEIEPQDKMKFLPFLIPRKRNCLVYIRSLFFEVLFSLIFMVVFIKNWV